MEAPAANSRRLVDLCEDMTLASDATGSRATSEQCTAFHGRASALWTPSCIIITTESVPKFIKKQTTNM